MIENQGSCIFTSFLQALLSGFVPLTFPFLQAICLLCLKAVSHHHKIQQEWVMFSNPMMPPSIYLGNLRYLFPHLKLHYYISHTIPHSHSFFKPHEVNFRKCMYECCIQTLQQLALHIQPKWMSVSACGLLISPYLTSPAKLLPISFYFAIQLGTGCSLC